MCNTAKRRMRDYDATYLSGRFDEGKMLIFLTLWLLLLDGDAV